MTPGLRTVVGARNDVLRWGMTIVHSRALSIETPGRGFTNLTGVVSGVVADARALHGLCTVFVHHTSASLLVQENADPAVRADLEAWFSRLIVDGDALFTHTDEGPDDMSAHVRSALTQVSVGIPIAKGHLDLGTWQALYLWEHRKSAHRRRLTVTIIGE
jgi:secondary thiamine-phosphate synthase enzyme